MDLFEERTISVYDVRTGPVPGHKNAKTVRGGRIMTSRGRAGRRKTELSDIAARMEKITEVLNLLKDMESGSKLFKINVGEVGNLRKRKIESGIIDRWSRIYKIRIDERGLLTIRVVFYLSDRKTRDADNMMSTALDCLKKAGIIRDDSINHIGEQSYAHRQVKKGREGFRATIIT